MWILVQIALLLIVTPSVAEQGFDPNIWHVLNFAQREAAVFSAAL